MLSWLTRWSGRLTVQWLPDKVETFRKNIYFSAFFGFTDVFSRPISSIKREILSNGFWCYTNSRESSKRWRIAMWGCPSVGVGWQNRKFPSIEGGRTENYNNLMTSLLSVRNLKFCIRVAVSYEFWAKICVFWYKSWFSVISSTP